MSVKLKLILFGVMILIANTHGNLLDTLDQMANTDQYCIGSLFKPLRDGFIEQGGLGIVYKGERLDNLVVAMKFVDMSQKHAADREYEMYAYLYAINNPAVEEYGFPAVYYYNEFEGHMVTVVSYFGDGDLADKINQGYFRNPVDYYCINSLILFREFVLQSKYMHACGIRHNDIKPGNIMLRGNRAFLIDLNVSTKMYEPSLGSTMIYASRNDHNGAPLTAMDDWESFLYTMCDVDGVELEWFAFKNAEGLELLTASLSCTEMKQNTKEILRRIKGSISSAALKHVYLAFAKEVFTSSSPIPNYDHLYKVITHQIRGIVGTDHPALFTWLLEGNSVGSSQSLSLPNIRSLVVPDDFSNFQYPQFDLDLFKGSSSGSAKKGKSKRKSAPSRSGF